MMQPPFYTTPGVTPSGSHEFAVFTGELIYATTDDNEAYSDLDARTDPFIYVAILTASLMESEITAAPAIYAKAILHFFLCHMLK